MQSLIEYFVSQRFLIENETIENLFTYHKQLEEALLACNDSSPDPHQKKNLSFALFDNAIEKSAKADRDLAEKTRPWCTALNTGMKKAETDDWATFYVVKDKQEVQESQPSHPSKSPSLYWPLEKNENEKDLGAKKTSLMGNIGNKIDNTISYVGKEIGEIPAKIERYSNNAIDGQLHKEVKEMRESKETPGLDSLEKLIAHLPGNTKDEKIKGITPFIPQSMIKNEVPLLVQSDKRIDSIATFSGKTKVSEGLQTHLKQSNINKNIGDVINVLM